MRKRGILLALIALMVLTALPAAGEGCFLLDLDSLDLNRAREADYISDWLCGEAQGLRVTKWISSGDEAPQRVRLIIMRQDGSVLLDKSYASVSGLFDSGDVYFTAADSANMRYEITLLAGTTVYQLPFERSPGRLINNTACTYGLRFIDGNGSLTDGYMMGTMMSLRELESAGGFTQISLCASNRYLVGVCDVALSGGQLTVTPRLYAAANAEIKRSYVYIIDNVSRLTAITPKEIGLPAYEPGAPIDVGGLDLIMLYVPIMLDYSPAMLSTFAYDLWGDGQLQRQLSLWDASWNQ